MELEGYDGLELVGSGGNAHVYRANEVGSDNVVAVKVLRGGGDDAVLRRFERERSLMAELEKFANVVPVFESGFAPSGDPYLVMPLYTGGSLQDKVDAGPMPWLEAVTTIRTLADAISLAHAKRILHLDIKPANVLLDGSGEVWLADFGIAEMMGSTTSMSAQMITPAFTPPERLDGAKPSEQTDTYGLVATLFALLSGKAPYTTPEATGPMSVIMSIMRDPVPVEELPAATPTSVRNLIQRGMAKDPAHRPRSAIELVGLLDDVLAGLPIDAAPEAAIDTAPSAPEVGQTMAVPTRLSQAVLPVEAEEEAEPNRRPVLWLVASLLAVVGVGVAALVLWPTGDDAETASVETASVETAEEVSSDAAVVEEADSGADDTEDADDDMAMEMVDPEGASDDDDPDGGEGSVDDSETDETPVVDDAPEDQTTTTQAAAPKAEDEITTEVAGVVLERDDTTTTSTTAPTTTTSTTKPTTTSSSTTSSTSTSTSTTSTSTSTSTTTTSTTTSSSTTEAPKPELEAGFRAEKGATGSEQTISFSNITVGDATSYRWEFGDGATSTQTSPSHTYASPGRYSVTLTAFGPGGVSDSATHPVQVEANTVKEEFEAGWTASASGSPNQQTLNFRSITIGDATSFSWNFGDGSTGTGETVSHTYAEPGTYSVTMTASGPGGTDSATHSVRVDPNE